MHQLWLQLYDVKNTGGILVCCEHGIITHDGSVKDYWVPADKYRVVAKYDEKIPLTDGLHQVRNLVLTGTFNPTDTEHQGFHIISFMK